MHFSVTPARGDRYVGEVVPGCFDVVAGEYVDRGWHGKEFWTEVLLWLQDFEPRAIQLNGWMEFPQRCHFQFDGSLSQLKALLRKAQDKYQFLADDRVEVWR